MKQIWENPEVQQLDRLPMRSPLLPYSTPQMALEETAAGPEGCPATASPFVQNIDGTWKFLLLDSPLDRTTAAGWTESGFNDTQWHNITVPGTWTLQGFDKPWYTNVQMPFDILPPRVPEQNPTGLYRLKVQIPALWKGRRIVLHIGSAESVTIAYVNGVQAGMSKDTRLPCEFDITPYIDWSAGKEGSALIAIEVIRWSDASFVEDQDQWWFGGIHRSVYLYSTEQTYIQDVQALSRYEVSGTTATGTIPLEVTMGYAPAASERLLGKTLSAVERVIVYEVRTLEGSPAAGTPGRIVASGTQTACFDYRRTMNQLRTSITIKNPRLWTNETPSLYLVTVSLHEPASAGTAASEGTASVQAGRHIETVCFTTGFKTVALENRELRFNGKMVYIHGVNRHEHNEYHGKTLTTEQMVKEMHLLKSYNFNAVRTCHYPDDERWYELCDRYGMYVLDEANVENHAYYDCMTRSDEWTGAYMTRVQRMVRRDKNHVSIFGWSLGNESGDGQNQVACAAWIRRTDPTRIVHYEGFVRAPWHQTGFTLETLARGKGLTDLISPMYPSIDLITEYADTCEDYRPIIMCEYSHAMGNANGSLGDYWRAIESHHGLQGGFIWDWIDQGLAAESANGKYWKYGGDFGDTPTDFDFCLNGLNFPDLTPKPAMEECRRLFAPVRMRAVHPAQGIFEIQNRYDFSTLRGLKLRWSLLKNGAAVKRGTVPLKATAPGAVQEIRLPLGAYTADTKNNIVLHAEFVYAQDTAWARKDSLCSRDEFIIHAASSLVNMGRSTPNSRKSAAEPVPADVSAVRALSQRTVQSVRPVLFRALTENEAIKKRLDQRHEPRYSGDFDRTPANEWLDADMPHMRIHQKNGSVQELLSGPDAVHPCTFGTVRCSARPCRSPDNRPGTALTVTFTLSKAMSEYPRAGITFPISAAYTTASWYGCGPQECYEDRRDGALLGMYTDEIQNLEVPYIVPQENGSRCGTTYLELTGGGQPLHIQSAVPFSFSISRHTLLDLWKCCHTSELTDTASSPDGFWTVTIDAAHRGVGTAACGPDTLEQYRVRPGVYRLSLVIW